MNGIEIVLGYLIKNKEVSIVLVGLLVASLWVQWSYDPRLVRLEGDVTEIKGDVKTMRGEITTIKGDVIAMRGEITTIKGDIIAMRGDIKVIDAKFDLLLLHIMPSTAKTIPQSNSQTAFKNLRSALPKAAKK